MHLWKPEHKLQELVLTFHHWEASSIDGAHVIMQQVPLVAEAACWAE